jgi:hypothetical protein
LSPIFVSSGFPTGGFFFIIFVDRIFTTFIERSFTNAFDATRKTGAMPCV